MSNQNHMQGFTLMEVMIAMAILAIALVAVFQSQSQSISMESNSRFLTTASLLAQSRMAEVEAMGPENIIANSGDFGDQFPDYTWRIEVKDTENEFMKKIEVAVTNQKLVLNNTYTLVLYMLFVK